MVQKYQSPVRVYKYPFELVMLAYERRFPMCPQIPVVLDCAVTSDVESSDGSTRTTVRRCKINVEAPYLLKKIIKVDVIYFIQKNVLNRRKRVLDIEVTNECFASRVNVFEHSRYYVHPENSDWTCFEQSANLEVKHFLGFESSIEKLAMKQYSANIDKGKEIVEYFINQLKNEGVTEAPIWTPPLNSSQGEYRDIGKMRKDTDLQENRKGDKFQLETESISRNLGKLSIVEESSLTNLKKLLGGVQKEEVPNDATLLRFLQARDFNVDKAHEMLSQSLAWRKKHGVDRILSEYVPPQVVKNYFPGCWHHHDKDNRPLFLLRLGQMDFKGFIKTIGDDGLQKLTVALCEEGLKLMEEATRTSGQLISKWTLLVDLEGLSTEDLWRPGIRPLLRIIKIVAANYPETMGRVILVRVPESFPIIWIYGHQFIDLKTKSKFLVFEGNDYLSPSGLINYVSKDKWPDFLGGLCQVMIALTQRFSNFINFAPARISSGGSIPKGLYIANHEVEWEGHAEAKHSSYVLLFLCNNSVWNIFFSTEEPQTVILWDLDVIGQDLMFSLISPKSSLAVKENYSTVESEHKSRKEIKCFKREEFQTICHDGERLQGSHVAKNPGCYSFEFKRYPVDHLNRLNGCDTHILFFYETLSSSKYRGVLGVQSRPGVFASLSNNYGTSSRPSK